MKKSLSLLLAIAMIFGAFASVALAADPTTTQEKFDALKAKGVFAGVNANGDAGLDQKMTRAQFARVLGLLAGLNVDAAPAKQDFTDVGPNFWAYQEVGAAFKAGLMVGIGHNKFNPNGNIIVQDLAITIVNVLGLKKVEGATVEGASPYAAPYIKALQDAGFALPTTYKVAATRALLVDAAYAVYVKITTPAVATATAAQTNSKELTVTFSRALTAAEKAAVTSFDLKNGLVSYTVTPKWSDDNKTVVLTSNYLPAGDYTLTVKGYAPITVKVVDEAPSKINITATSLQKADSQDLGIQLVNQFGKEIANPILNVSVYNATYGKTITTRNVDGTFNLSSDAVARVDDNVIVTVTHSSGLSATKTFKVVAGSAATSIKLGAVAPLKDKTRITAGDAGLVVPVELKDQYGGNIKLGTTIKTPLAATATNFTISGVTFMLSEAGVVSNYQVDSNGVLTIDVAKATTLVINAVNPATGATGSTIVKIEGAAVVKTLQLSNPGFLIVANEEIAVPFAAADQFGSAIAGKDIVINRSATPAPNTVTFNSNVTFAAGYPKVNGKGELLFKFASTLTNDTTAYIYAYVNGAQVGQLQLAVKKVATPVRINGVSTPSYMANGAAVDFNANNITYLDSYNRTINVAADTFTVVSSDNSIVDAATAGKLIAKKVGTADITVDFKTGAVAGTSYKFTVQVVNDSDITSYSINSIGTIYGKADAVTVSNGHEVEVGLVGKLSNGSVVALVSPTAYDFLTTSEQTKIAVVGKKIVGIAAGTSTIAVYKGAAKVAEQVVTVSEATPVASKIVFSSADYSLDKAGDTLTLHVNTATEISVQDQYGVEITAVGFMASSDTNVATVAPVTGTKGNNDWVVTGKAPGQATLTYITANNVTATTTIVVN